jgi:hypothetical protein
VLASCAEGSKTTTEGLWSERSVIRTLRTVPTTMPCVFMITSDEVESMEARR